MAMDVSLKQRLIGAVVLIALAVIFLPLLVKGPAPDSGVSGVSLRMPPEPQPNGDRVTEDLPLDAPIGAVPAGGVTGMPAPEPGQPTASPQTAPPLEAVAAGDFVVEFGSYRNVADADKVVAALRAAGLPGHREQAAAGNRDVQRVRIGPFADQAMAESARIRAGQVNPAVAAKVVALDAATPATTGIPATTPTTATPAGAVASPAAAAAKPVAEAPKPAPAAAAANPASAQPEPAAKPAATPAAEPARTPPANAAGTGFVVQIGAFASAQDAAALRDAMRKSGFNAFTDTVPSERGTLTRVRVGPVMTRAEADALKAQVKAKTGKDGMVRPHP